MKKRILAVLCVIAIIMTGCSGQTKEEEADQVAKDLAEMQSKDVKETESSEPATAEPTQTPAPAKLELEGEIFDGKTSSPKNLVPLGQWASIEVYNASSDKKETCYLRVNEIVRDQSKVQEIIADFNKKFDDKIQVEDKYKDSFELVAINYELGFPAEWTTQDGTIRSSIDATFTAQNKDGKVGFPTKKGERYIGGFSTSANVMRGRTDFPTPGSTIKGTAVIEMAKGFNDFYLKYYSDKVLFDIK